MIDEQEFFHTWKDVCKKDDNHKRLFKAWHFPTDYTDVILKSNNSIISQISKAINIDFDIEYYHIDAVFYDVNDCVQPNPKNKTWGHKSKDWLTRIIIAVEHENNLKTTFQEIAHLLTTNADFKVVVIYSGCADADACADDFATILEKANSDKILLIIGYCEKKVIGWNGYILSKSGAEKIT